MAPGARVCVRCHHTEGDKEKDVVGAINNALGEPLDKLLEILGDSGIEEQMLVEPIVEIEGWGSF